MATKAWSRYGWAAVLAVGLLGVATADEKVVLPDPVKQAIEAAFPGAKVTVGECEREPGSTVYEVEFRVAGQEVEVVVDEAGTISKIERELAMAAVPATVCTACEEKFPGAKLLEVEQREIRAVRLFGAYAALKEPVTVYEVELRKADGKKTEVVVANGKVQPHWSDADDGDDDDDDDDDD